MAEDLRFMAVGTIDPQFYRRILSILGRSELSHRPVGPGARLTLKDRVAVAFCERTRSAWINAFPRLTPVSLRYFRWPRRSSTRILKSRRHSPTLPLSPPCVSAALRSKRNGKQTTARCCYQLSRSDLCFLLHRPRPPMVYIGPPD